VDPLEKLPRTPFRQSEAAAWGVSPRTLYRLRDRGQLFTLGHGIYQRAGAESTDADLAEIAMRAPEATICLASALARHGLTDAIPSETDVAIHRRRTPPRTTAAVRWHRFAEDTFDLGREAIPVEGAGLTIGIYSAERSIVDAFRLRGTEGYELATEALRTWLRRRGSNPAELLKIARQIPRAQGPLRQAIELLAA